MGRWEVKTGSSPVPASLVYTVVIYKREGNADGKTSQMRKEASQRGQRWMLFTQIKIIIIIIILLENGKNAFL